MSTAGEKPVRGNNVHAFLAYFDADAYRGFNCRGWEGGCNVTFART